MRMSRREKRRMKYQPNSHDAGAMEHAKIRAESHPGSPSSEGGASSVTDSGPDKRPDVWDAVEGSFTEGPPTEWEAMDRDPDSPGFRPPKGIGKKLRSLNV
jgi:hypothetical protein